MEITNKGIVFSLDAAIAVTVVIILLINTSYYFSTASRESVSQLHLIRIGNDVLHMLDLNGDLRQAILEDYKPTNTPQLSPVIEDKFVNVTRYLPEGYDMKVFIFDMGETVVNAAANLYTPCYPPGNPSSYLDCYCTNSGCNGTFNVSTPSLEKAARYGVRLNVTAYGNSSIVIYTHGGSGSLGTVALSESYSGMTLGSPLDLNRTGMHYLLFQAKNATVHWFTLLGAKEYAGATPRAIPVLANETFIGSGEKILALNETSYADFGRIVRYLIWVK